MPSNRAGIGNPFETPYGSEQYRDPGQGQPRPKDCIYDPLEDPSLIPEEKRQNLRDFFAVLRDVLPKLTVFTKRPAFLEPPYFAKPKILINEVTLPPAGAALTPIITRTIQARQRALITAIGIEVDQPAVYNAHQLYFTFTVNGEIAPIFEDASVAGLQAGYTTRVPGNLGAPCCLISNGLQSEVKGAATLVFAGQNVNPGVPVVVTAMIGLYEYWMPEATEFEGGDMQV